MGFRDYHLEIDIEEGRGSLFIYENNTFHQRKPSRRSLIQ